ncbi:MAG: hypothetical protein OJF49_000431 [Ktedonobacterales bacterium]|nr:MAG: hypothetical protein OJF49_000431 [Ktedonobacterales bacterium]
MGVSNGYQCDSFAVRVRILYGDLDPAELLLGMLRLGGLC